MVEFIYFCYISLHNYSFFPLSFLALFCCETLGDPQWHQILEARQHFGRINHVLSLWSIAKEGGIKELLSGTETSWSSSLLSHSPLPQHRSIVDRGFSMHKELIVKGSHDDEAWNGVNRTLWGTVLVGSNLK